MAPLLLILVLLPLLLAGAGTPATADTASSATAFGSTTDADSYYAGSSNTAASAVINLPASLISLSFCLISDLCLISIYLPDLSILLLIFSIPPRSTSQAILPNPDGNFVRQEHRSVALSGFTSWTRESVHPSPASISVVPIALSL